MWQEQSIDSTVSVAPLSADDMASVRALLASGKRSHIHLDWRELDDMLNDKTATYWGARRSNGRLVAGLGVTPMPGGAAWMRLAVVRDGSKVNLLDKLWEKIRPNPPASPVAVLAFDKWLEKRLKAWGFQPINAVITMQLKKHLPNAADMHTNASKIVIRDAEMADLPTVAKVDTAAFETLWQHSANTLARASEEAATFTVAELDGRIIGYQLSTQHGPNGHLARLAIDPDFQRMGVAQKLVTDMLSFFENQGTRTITVNTQEDNYGSQKLYRKMGFEQANHSVVVWAYG